MNHSAVYDQPIPCDYCGQTPTRKVVIRLSCQSPDTVNVCINDDFTDVLPEENHDENTG